MWTLGQFLADRRNATEVSILNKMSISSIKKTPVESQVRVVTGYMSNSSKDRLEFVSTWFP